MTEHRSSELPCVVLFNINGSGMGHMSTCLAYANRLRGRARPVFFSLASAIESIQEMGFEADYMISRFWSRASAWVWDQQLALRLGLLFERVQPKVVVFDGTWPYRGLMHACRVYGIPALVWSNLTLYKKGIRKVPVAEKDFDLVIGLGEVGSTFLVERAATPGRKVIIPPATILPDTDLMSRDTAREALGFEQDGRYALFSLGPGNLKDVSEVGRALIDEVMRRGYRVVWVRPPISLKDVDVPQGVICISVYPLARYMRAFDIFVGAAGYNTCCEVLQSGVPALFVPNEMVADDQTGRALKIARISRAVVSSCETPSQTARAVDQVLSISAAPVPPTFDLSGADYAADEILRLVDCADAL